VLQFLPLAFSLLLTAVLPIVPPILAVFGLGGRHYILQATGMSQVSWTGEDRIDKPSLATIGTRRVLWIKFKFTIDYINRRC
jgi:hypothetical protein